MLPYLKNSTVQTIEADIRILGTYRPKLRNAFANTR